MPREFRLDDVVAELRRAFGDFGLIAPTEIVVDGHWHPTPALGGRYNDAGRYLVFTDDPPTALLHNWRTGENLTWHPERAVSRMTAADRAEAARRAAEAREEREVSVEFRQAKVADESERSWSAMVDCTHGEYLDSKRVAAYGLRKSRFGGTLFVPMRDIDGRLWGLQEIWTDGTKLYQPGARVTGLFHHIGDLVDGRTILIGEGYATAATAFEATGEAAVIAFTARNLLAVASALRERYPTSSIVLLADDDSSTKGNPGLTKARHAALAVGGKLAVPVFGDDREGATDFNDLAAVAGLNEARCQIDAASAPEPEQPTYPTPDRTLDLATARAEQARLMADFAHASVDWINRAPLDLNDAPVDCINAPPGLGKTRTALEIVVPAVLQAGITPLIAIPTHDLGEQQVRDLAAIGIKARTYRARGAADPEAREMTMCRETDRTGAIGSALGDISVNACKSAKGVCDHYETCGYQRQKKDPPEVWLVAHQLLYHQLPAFIPQPDIVIIDEAFHSAGDQKDIALDLNLLVHNRTWSNDLLRRLSEYSFGVLSQLREPCRLRRDMFGAISASDAREAYRLEWKRKQDLDDVVPGMPRETAIARARLREQHNQEVKALAKFWELLSVTLEDDWEESLYLKFSPNCSDERSDKTFPGVVISSRLDLHESITGCPVLHLDGTMHELIVQQFFPHATFHNISVRMPPMTTASLLQVTDRAFGKSAKSPKLLEEYRRLIEVAADDAGSGKVGVIALKDIEVELKKNWTPPRNVELAHYGAVTGKNNFGDVSDLILIGRPEPAPFTVEQTARLLFRRPVAELPAGTYYPETRRGMAIRDSDAIITLPGSCHPDAGVEALRRVACEGGVLQALHRARGINRTAASPLLLRIATNVCLPIEVDTAMTWEQMRPTLLEAMLARRGIAVKSYADMATAFPELFKDAAAGRDALVFERRLISRISYKIILLRNPTNFGGGFLPIKPTGSYREILPIKSVKYRRAGARGPWSTAFFHDGIDPREQLQQLLGCEVVLLEGEP